MEPRPKNWLAQTFAAATIAVRKMPKEERDFYRNLIDCPDDFDEEEALRD